MLGGLFACVPPQSRYARQLSRAGRALPSVIVRAANALTLRKRRAQRTVLCAKNAFATHGGAMHAPPEESLLMPPPEESLLMPPPEEGGYKKLNRTLEE